MPFGQKIADFEEFSQHNVVLFVEGMDPMDEDLLYATDSEEEREKAKRKLHNFHQTCVFFFPTLLVRGKLFSP